VGRSSTCECRTRLSTWSRSSRPRIKQPGVVAVACINGENIAAIVEVGACGGVGEVGEEVVEARESRTSMHSYNNKCPVGRLTPREYTQCEPLWSMPRKNYCHVWAACGMNGSGLLVAGRMRRVLARLETLFSTLLDCRRSCIKPGHNKGELD